MIICLFIAFNVVLSSFQRTKVLKFSSYDEPSKLKEHFRKGITTLLVIGAGVLFFFCIYRFTSITSAFDKFFEVLAPITYGFVFAFLLNPIVMWVERLLNPRLHKVFGKEETAQKVSELLGS